MSDINYTDMLTAHMQEQYNAIIEHPWAEYPEYITFKECESQKWFALIMQVTGKSLGHGLVADRIYPVINLKADPGFIMFSDSFEGIYPAYHMNKRCWITALLDGTVPEERLKALIEESYRIISYSPTKKIYEAVKKIPRGKVATYGQVAQMAGDKKMARAVGNALHKNNDPEHIPCYRVVNSKGELAGAFAFGGAEVQAELLRKDGIEVKNQKVDLSVYGIDPASL